MGMRAAIAIFVLFVAFTNRQHCKPLVKKMFTLVESGFYKSLHAVKQVETPVKRVENQETAENPKLKKLLNLYKGTDAENFGRKLARTAEKLGLKPEWMLMVMLRESGLDPQARNSIGAAGLIQFKPETAISLGTTTAKLLNMNGSEQLVYIEKFWLPAKGKTGSYSDLRLYNLFPAALGRPDTFILQCSELSAQAVAQRNPSFDLDGDMQITVGEFKKKVSHEQTRTLAR